MTSAIRFVASAEPSAWLIYDSNDQRVHGSVHQTIGGGFAYQRGRWNGERQVFDHLQAASLEALGQRIESYLENITGSAA